MKLNNLSLTFFFAAIRYSNLTLLSDGRVKCNLCAKVLSNAKTAKQHTASMHEAPEYFECVLCKRVFNNRPNFRGHINHSHGIRGRDLVGSYGRAVHSMPEN